MIDLNIVAFTVPYPADYGGVIDVFYKLKSLHQLGLKIHLHCFKYDRNPAKELEPFCSKISYYDRRMSLLLLMRKLPFIVESRYSEELINNLQSNEAPILFEGLHTCGIFNDSRINDRVKIVRSHNIEHDYYRKLAEAERGKAKRIYLKQEARKLEVFEEEIYEKADYVLGISKKDTEYLLSKYGNAVHVSAFHQFEKVQLKNGVGDFAFYHGNLEVAENEKAAMFLVKHVFNDINIPLVIAGNGASKKLINLTNKQDNVKLVQNASPKEIIELLQNAQVNVLPTFQSTGIKLKLLSALYRGRFCLVNTPMVKGTSLEDLCIKADSPDEFKSSINMLFKEHFDSDKTSIEREKHLQEFSNKFNAEKIIELLRNQ